jgi:hypothetical protein
MDSPQQAATLTALDYKDLPPKICFAAGQELDSCHSSPFALLQAAVSNQHSVISSTGMQMQ